MKNTKKLAAMIAALTLSVCSIAPMFSFAEETPITSGSITITTTEEDHVYSAYQIFDGTLSKDTDSKAVTFTGITWGSGIATTEGVPNAIDGKTIYTALSELGVLVDNSNVFTKTVDGSQVVLENASEVAAALSKVQSNDGANRVTTYADIDKIARVFETYKSDTKVSGSYTAGTGYKINIDDPGYYLVVETQPNGGLAEGEAVTKYILQVADDVAVNPKSDIPKVTKKVMEDTHTIADANNYASDTTDKLEQEVNSDNSAIVQNDATDTRKWNDIADYDIGDEVPFKLYGTLPQDYATYDSYYYCFHDTLNAEFDVDDKTVFTVKIDGKTAPSDSYSVTVTPASASTSRKNEIDIEFANLKDIKDGETPVVTKDSVITVEYKAKLNANAIVGTSGQDNAVKLEYSNNPNNGGDGETGTTPEKKVRVYTYAFEIEKTFFEASGSPLTVDELDSNTYGAVKFKLYKGTGNTKTALKFKKLVQGDDGYGTYDYVVDDTATNDILTLTEVGGEDGDLTARKDNKLVIRIKGLDDDTYTLEESEAPAGYNKADDKVVTISAKTNNTQKWDMTNDTLDEFSWTVDGTEGKATSVEKDKTIAEAIVENRKGSTLPSTGGIGTTIFYLGGGAMVAVAGVFLITKKRMGKSEN